MDVPLVVYQSWFESIDTLTLHTYTIQMEEFIYFFSGSYLVTTPRNMGIQKRKGNIHTKFQSAPPDLKT